MRKPNEYKESISIFRKHIRKQIKIKKIANLAILQKKILESQYRNMNLK